MGEFKRKWENTISVNARHEVIVLASIASWLQKEGVLLKTSSDIVRSALKLLTNNIPEENIFASAQEASKFLLQNGLVQNKSIKRAEDIVLKLGEKKPSQMDELAEKIAKKLKEGE